MKKLILLISIISLPAFGVTHLKEGDPAPHEGYLFSKTEEKQLRYIKAENIKLKDLMVLKDKKIDIQGKRITYLEAKVKKQTTTGWTKILYFGLGIVVTSAAVYGAGQLVK